MAAVASEARGWATEAADGVAAMPPTRLGNGTNSAPFDSRIIQYEKERLERTERRVRATVQASISSSVSVPELPTLSKKANIAIAYGDPVHMPGPSKMQRLIQSELQDLRQEISASERRGHAWQEREDSRAKTVEQQRASEIDLSKRLEREKQKQRTRAELEEMVLALTEQVRQLVHQSAGIAERAREEALAEARQELEAAKARASKARRASRAELEAAFEREEQLKQAVKQAEERRKQMLGVVEKEQEQRFVEKTALARRRLHQLKFGRAWGRWRADWEAAQHATRAKKYEEALAAAAAWRLEAEHELRGAKDELRGARAELREARAEAEAEAKRSAAANFALQAAKDAEAQRRRRPPRSRPRRLAAVLVLGRL